MGFSSFLLSLKQVAMVGKSFFFFLVRKSVCDIIVSVPEFDSKCMEIAIHYLPTNYRPWLVARIRRLLSVVPTTIIEVSVTVSYLYFCFSQRFNIRLNVACLSWVPWLWFHLFCLPTLLTLTLLLSRIWALSQLSYTSILLLPSRNVLGIFWPLMTPFSLPHILVVYILSNFCFCCHFRVLGKTKLVCILG